MPPFVLWPGLSVHREERGPLDFLTKTRSACDSKMHLQGTLSDTPEWNQCYNDDTTRYCSHVLRVLVHLLVLVLSSPVVLMMSV